MTNKPASLTKRVLAASIDFIAILILISCIMAVINLTPLVKVYEEAANSANGIYNSLATSLGIGTLVDVSGVISLSHNSSVTSEDLTYFNSVLSSNKEFISFYDKAMNYRLLVNILAVGIAEALYLLIIPLFNKKGQTPGKMLFDLGVVDIRYDMFLDKKNKAIRFLVGFGIETCLLLWLFKNSGAMMVAMFAPLLVLTMIMFSQSKQALHDLLSHAKVVDLKVATIFDSIEEKAEYDEQYLSKEESDNFDDEIIDDDEIIETEIVEKSESSNDEVKTSEDIEENDN